MPAQFQKQRRPEDHAESEGTHQPQRQERHLAIVSVPAAVYTPSQFAEGHKKKT